MAEILALGISHYPPLAGPDARMAFILKAMLKNPKLPAKLRDPSGWPQAMRAEWGDDEEQMRCFWREWDRRVADQAAS